MITVVLCALGYLVRDGQPSFKVMLSDLQTGPLGWLYHLSTQLARITGAAICGLGFLATLSPISALLMALAVLASYYTDMKHGEGQGAATWQDAMWLTLSGVTSFIPIALMSGYLFGWIYSLSVLLGLLKAPIWFAWGHSPIQKVGAWFQPTRFSAMTFGALTGLISLF